MGLAQQLQMGKVNLPSADVSKGHHSRKDSAGGKRKRVLESDSLASDSDSGSSDPFADKKKRVKLDSDQEAYVGKVFRTWLPGKGADKRLKKCYPLKGGLTVPRAQDEWMLNLLDKSVKQKVEAEDLKFCRLSKKLHMVTGLLFKVGFLAEDKEDKSILKHIKKAVLVVGQMQLALNQGRHMLSYGEVCRDQRNAKDHLKEVSDSFGKAAEKAEKPPLFGEKFQRAVIDRGTLSKQLKEAKQQLERRLKPRPPQACSVNVQYSSPLQRVNQPVQQTHAQTYETQPVQRDPTKISSGRGRVRGTYGHKNTLCTLVEHGCQVASLWHWVCSMLWGRRFRTN